MVFVELFNFNFFSITGWGVNLDYCDVELFALELSLNHSFTCETASENCIVCSFIDYVGYSISSKGILSIVVDIMVI